MAKTGTGTGTETALTDTGTITAATLRHIKPAARIFNFGAGPAAMPVEVLEKAKWELVTWQNVGMSVMDMSHRGEDVVKIAAGAAAELRRPLAIPKSYRRLLLHAAAP